MTTIALGLAGIQSFIGFGNSGQSLTTLGATIDLTNASGTLKILLSLFRVMGR